MQIKNIVLVDPEFAGAFESLMQKEMTVDKCLEMSEAVEALSEQASIINRARKAIVEKYAVIENGKVLPDDRGQVRFKDMASAEKCFTEVEELLSKETEIKLSEPLVIYDDEKMTPKKYNLLKSLVKIEKRNKS